MYGQRIGLAYRGILYENHNASRYAPTPDLYAGEWIVVQKRDGFRWYWLLAFETTSAFFVIGAAIIAFRDISVWAKYVCTVIVALALHQASRYGERLRQRLGPQWVDRPISWRLFWWSVTVIAVLAPAF